MNNRSTYIPTRLLLYRSDRYYGGPENWKIFGIGPDNCSLFPDPMDSSDSRYYLKDLIEALMKYKSRIFNGDIPEELKNNIKIIPNLPFRPEITSVSFDSEDNLMEESTYVTIINPNVSNLILSLTPKNKNLALLRLGVYRGKIQRDAIVGYSYEKSGYSINNISSPPYELVLVESSGEYYEDIQRRSEWMRKYPSTIENLEVGRVYQMKGHVELSPDNKDSTSKYITRQAIYLGKFKFANGTIVNGGDPGSKYTRIDTFISMEHWESELKKEGAPLTIFTVSKDCILCPSIDHPELLPSQDIQEIHTRFEKSMWSYEFWKTPGVVNQFLPIIEPDIELLDKWEKEQHKFWGWDILGHGINFFPPSLYSTYPVRSINIVIPKTIMPSNSYGNRLLTLNSANNYYIPATIDVTDPLSPIKIIPKPKENLDNWLGGKGWKDNDSSARDNIISKIGKDIVPENKRGIKYITYDGYIFWQCYTIFQSFKASMFKSTDCSGSFRQWTICGRIE